MIVAPPFDTGVVKATVNCAALPVTELIVGADGAVTLGDMYRRFVGEPYPASRIVLGFAVVMREEETSLAVHSGCSDHRIAAAPAT